MPPFKRSPDANNVIPLASLPSRQWSEWCIRVFIRAKRFVQPGTTLQLDLQDSIESGTFMQAVATLRSAEMLASKFEIGKRYLIAKPAVLRAATAPPGFMQHELVLEENSAVQLVEEETEKVDPEVDRIRRGLLALNRARDAVLISREQHRQLKSLLFEGNNALKTAVQAYENHKNVNTFSEDCMRILSSPTSSSSIFSSESTVAVKPTTNVTSMPTFSSPLVNHSFSLHIGGNEASSPAAASLSFSNFNFGSPSLFSPQPSFSKPADETEEVSSLLNKITHRQEATGANDDDDLQSATALLKQLQSESVMARVSFPDCSIAEFQALCEAATTVQRLRVMLNSSDQVNCLVKLINQSKHLKSLDISHSSIGAVDFASLLTALGSSCVKALNAEFCNLRDDDLMCNAIEECLPKNHTLRKLNFDGNYLSDNFLSAFARGLRSNTSLELVHFATNLLITPRGLQALVDALDHNTSLKGVHLYANPNLRGSPLLPLMLEKLQKNIRK